MGLFSWWLRDATKPAEIDYGGPPLVWQIVMRQELIAIAEQRVLPRALAEEVAVAVSALVMARIPQNWWEMRSNDRFELYYVLMREVVEHPGFAGRVSLFQYNDADKLGQALAQLDADRAASPQKQE